MWKKWFFIALNLHQCCIFKADISFKLAIASYWEGSELESKECSFKGSGSAEKDIAASDISDISLPKDCVELAKEP
jgi:hypothetical protein